MLDDRRGMRFVLALGHAEPAVATTPQTHNTDFKASSS
jgi:hypothetical protein